MGNAFINGYERGQDDDDETQVEMFPGQLGEEPSEKIFEVELSLTLKAPNGKPHKLPLLAGSYDGRNVEGLLVWAVRNRRSRTIISAILDNPPPKASADEENEK